MDFATLPPEINSARMYSGPGAGPMLAAAASWDALAAELQTVATVYESVIAELSTGWFGPSATSMAAAATPYAKWMHTTSAQAEQTAIQARAVVAAYETAFAMTVPPPVVAANRAQLMTLVATNFLGQNTPAIAANEALYAEMWAQDATAMYGYAHSAAAAAALAKFERPPQTTDPAGLSARTAAVGHAVAAHATHTLASPTTATAPVHGSTLSGAVTPATAAAPATELAVAGLELIIESAGSFGIDALGSFLIDPLGLAEIGAGLLPLEEIAGALPAVASLGSATLLNGLAVPQAWTVALTSAGQPAGASLATAVGAALPVVETAVPFAGMAAAGLAGRATTAVGQGGRGGAGTTTRQRPPVPEQPERLPYALLVGVDIELRELAELRQTSVLTEEEYAQQKRRLFGR